MIGTGRTDFERLAGALLRLAEAAAEPILDIYRSGNLDVSYKSKDDPVTAADKLANAQIVEGLRVLCPGVPVVAEESESSSYGDYQRSTHRSEEHTSEPSHRNTSRMPSSA